MLINCPVVRASCTIMCAPVQLISRIQAYTVKFITGLFQMTMLSALQNILYRLPLAVLNFSTS